MNETVTPFLSETGDGVLISCRVVPSSSRNMFSEICDGYLKIKVTAAPVEGKANKALVAFLAKILGVAKSDVIIVKGETGKIKKIAVRDINAGDAMKKIQEAF